MPNHNKKIAKKLSPARQLALRALLSMQARDETLQAALNATLALAGIAASREDKALCTSLVYGCVRLEIRLDWILNQYFKKPESVPGAMRRVMRMAAFELLYLSHVPSYATLSSYVEAIKAGYGQSMAGLANAVLRKISKTPACGKAWFEQQLPVEREFNQVWYSLPAWLLEHFTACFPWNEAVRYLDASIEPPPLGVRVNPLTGKYAEISAALQQLPDLLGQSGNAFAYTTGYGPELGLMLTKGEASKQSYAAQVAMQTIFGEIQEDAEQALKLGTIWDVCAGQGGKTCWMLEQGLPVECASDVSLSRLKHLSQEIHRLKLPSPMLFAANATLPLPVKRSPGIILVDAPCSGLGTLSRRPDIKLRRCPEDLTNLAEIQQAILEAQYPRLPQNGLLIYLTCTLNPIENEQLIDKFAKNSDARVIFKWQNPANNFSREFFWAAVLKKGQGNQK